jgi:phospholipase D3/4
MLVNNIQYHNPFHVSGTSNWSGDYFITTGGIGLVIDGSNQGNQNDIRAQLAAVFERDWNSQYAKPLNHFNSTLPHS